MAEEGLLGDPSGRGTCRVVQVFDPREMGTGSPVSQRFLEEARGFRYRLRDQALMRMRFEDPIFRVAIGRIGDIMISQGADRFATEIAVAGDASHSYYCFHMVTRGELSVIRNGTMTTASGITGLACRADAGIRYLTSDLSTRANLFIRVADLRDALEGMLGERMHDSLDFRPSVDWSKGLAASVKSQFDFLLSELKRPDGIASNPILVASLADWFSSFVLHGIPHNYSDKLELRRSVGVPSYLRRAEDFMRANAATPIRMPDVAAAAGCSVRTLSDVFQQFRGTTPLKALRAIRLECVREALREGEAEASYAEVARRYGFTNPWRFAEAYRRRFAETPGETGRRGRLQKRDLG